MNASLVWVVRILLLVTSLQASWAFAGDWPAIPVPDEARLSVVGEDLALGSVPVKIWRFDAWISLDEALAYYRAAWSEPAAELQGQGAPGMLESRQDEWTILSRYEKGYLTTVQLQASGREAAQGLIAVSKLPQAEVDLPQSRKVLLDPQAQITSDIGSVDGNKRARTITATTTSSLSHAVAAYRSLYGRAGWTELTAGQESAQPAGVAMMFNRAGEEVSLVLAELDGTTAITLVHVRF